MKILASWLYDRTTSAVPRFLAGAIPAIVAWAIAKTAMDALFSQAMHQPPTGADRGTEFLFASLIAYFVGSLAMVMQATWMAEWRWSEHVAARENVSPTFLRLATGITTGPFDVPTRPSFGGLIFLALIGAPVYAPWLAWRALMATCVILGFRYFIGRFLSIPSANVFDIASGARIRVRAR